MRTTVDLDEDVLRAAKNLAAERQQSLGRVLSELARKGLQPPPGVSAGGAKIPTLTRRNGGRLVTAQDVKDLLESEA